jgi:hypothetical protein
MARVEWVTDQVRWRKGRGGGVKVVFVEELVYLEGRRIVMVLAWGVVTVGGSVGLGVGVVSLVAMVRGYFNGLVGG